MRILTQLEADRIYKKWCMGYTIKALAEEHYVSKSTIYRAIDYRPFIPFEGEWQNSPIRKRKRRKGTSYQ